MQVVSTTNSHDTIRCPGKEDLTVMPLALLSLLPIIPPRDKWSADVYRDRKFAKVVLSTVQKYTYMADNIGFRAFMGYDGKGLHVEDFTYEGGEHRYFRPDQYFLDQIQWDSSI